MFDLPFIRNYRKFKTLKTHQFSLFKFKNHAILGPFNDAGNFQLLRSSVVSNFVRDHAHFLSILLNAFRCASMREIIQTRLVIPTTCGDSYTVGVATAPTTFRFAQPFLCNAPPTFVRFDRFLDSKRTFSTAGSQSYRNRRRFGI